MGDILKIKKNNAEFKEFMKRIVFPISLLLILLVGCILMVKVVQQKQNIHGDATENNNVKTFVSPNGNIGGTALKPNGIVLIHSSLFAQKTLKNYLQGKQFAKKWFPLIVSTKDPQKIKREIVEVTRSFKSIRYLLIIGSEQTIPLEDISGLVMPYIPGAPSNAVLDNFYYGDLDNDLFVDLGVGRIPTDEISKILDYFSYSGPTEKMDTFAVQYQAGFRENICAGENLNVQVISNTTRENVVEALKTSTIFGIETHGSQDFWEVGFSSNDIPPLSDHPVVIAGSCETSAILGKNFILKGASAYFGYWTLAPGYDTVIPLYRKIRQGVALGDAVKEFLNQNLSDFIVRNHDDFVGGDYPAFQTLSVVSEKNKIRSAAGRHAFAAGLLLYGDPTVILKKTLSEKPTLSETKTQIKLFLPANKYQLEEPDPVTGIRQATFCSSNKSDLYQSWFTSIAPNNDQGQFAELPPLALAVQRSWKSVIKGSWQINNNVPFIVPEMVSNYFATLVRGLSQNYLVLHDHLFLVDGLGKKHEVTIDARKQ